MRKSILLALMLIGAVNFATPHSAARAAAVRYRHSASIVVNGVTYPLVPGIEMTIPLIHTVKGDPRFIATTLHIKMHASPTGITPLDSYIGGSNGGSAWFSNGFNTTLGSYALSVSYTADITNSQIVNYYRDTDSWYANTGLFWYYNTRLNVNTTLYRQSATVASTIHFTGPFFQTQNVEVAVDMHAYSGYANDDWRWYINSGDPPHVY